MTWHSDHRTWVYLVGQLNLMDIYMYTKIKSDINMMFKVKIHMILYYHIINGVNYDIVKENRMILYMMLYMMLNMILHMILNIISHMILCKIWYYHILNDINYDIVIEEYFHIVHNVKYDMTCDITYDTKHDITYGIM